MGAAAILWKRAGEAGLDEDDRGLLAAVPLEKLIERCWRWYASLMQRRRPMQFDASEDR